MNKNRLALLCCLALALAAPSCAEVAQACITAAVAGAKAVAGVLNDAIQSCPTPTIGPGPTAISPKVTICAGSSCTTADACGAFDGDSVCNTCLKGACCSQVAAFLVDPIAPCIVGCVSGGADCGGTTMADATAHCGAGPDAAYNTLAACASDHCAGDCAGLNLQ
jgi:hypothetical protein